MSLSVDTNVVLFLLNDRLAEPLPKDEYFISVITEMELLSYPLLNQDELSNIERYLEDATVIGLTDSVKSTAIEIRRSYGLKLPDAIIAATALALDIQLLSNDKAFQRVPGLLTTSVRLKS